jgi:Domain of unknown function (DUF4145)
LKDIAKSVLIIANKIHEEAQDFNKPPSEGLRPKNERVLAFSIVKNTRGYIEKIVNQINGTYENGCYDACAVMIRRLIETLIIETFEYHRLEAKIKNASGDYFYLKDLIDITLAETSWNLTRNTKQALPKLKDVGDKSAHSRRYIAHRKDIEDLIGDIRVVAQELIYLSKLQP